MEYSSFFNYEMIVNELFFLFGVMNNVYVIMFDKESSDWGWGSWINYE